MRTVGITWGAQYWSLALIIAASVLGILFFPAELYAMFTNHNNTLSDYCRTQLDVTTAFGARTRLHTLAWWSSILVWSGFVIWITGHIWFDTWG